MTLTFGLWVIPTIATVAMLIAMLRPYQSSGSFDFGAVFRILWLIPLMFVWLLYLLILLWAQRINPE